MKRLVLLLFFVGFSVAAFAQTDLKGKVVDVDNDEPLILATVQLFRNGVFVQGMNTDFDGNYYFASIDPGTYSLRVGYTGYPDQELKDIPVYANKTNVADVEMTSDGGVALDEVIVKGFRKPLVDPDRTTSGGVVTAEEIENLPTRNINAIASTVAGVASSDEGSALTIRGSRSNATDYYVDGVRVSSVSIPDQEIEQLEVITGGVSARYGDVTGGIISITTKGFSDNFRINAEAETSEGLDNFGNSLAGLSLSGPIAKKDNGKAFLGYRISGRYTYREDDDPSAVPVFRARDDVQAELEANPVVQFGPNRQNFPAADALREGDAEALVTRPNEEFSLLNLNANVTAFLTDNIDIQLTGAYNEGSDRFTPNLGWRLFNADRNPSEDFQTYRGNVRLRHRLGSNRKADGQNATTTSLIQNASYDLQFTYEKNERVEQDPIHGDNFGAYGKVGDFDVDYIPVITRNFDENFTDDDGNFIPFDDPRRYVHTNYRTILRGVDFSDSPNPILANYNNGVATDDGPGFTSDEFAFIGLGEGALNLDNFIANNGFTQTAFRTGANFFSNVGTVYNLYQTVDNDRYTFQANAQFQIVPGGKSDKSRHSISLGVWYEQRTTRFYQLQPQRLWVEARQRANAPFDGVDPSNRVTGTITVPAIFGASPNIQDSVTVETYAPSGTADTDGFFNRVRNRFGVGLDEYFNVDGLSASELTLDLFSPFEATNSNLLQYAGYDYLGNEFNGSFDDFFAVNEDTGERAFDVAPFRPIYAAAYIQDKFTINDLIFRLGVRVDRYDANTRVLQDPYSLYATQSAADFYADDQQTQVRPGNIGDDFAVYLDDYDNREVVAFRDGDLWFAADGTPVNQAIEIGAIRSGLVNPALSNQNAEGFDGEFIQSDEFTVESSFRDYEVQFNVMPRMAFSFPISDRANFFAHYDVLVQRPPSNTIFTALDYYYFVQRTGNNRVVNNPALRPERTINYEVGFETILGQRSALTINTYYKELRDMIQQRTFQQVLGPNGGQYTTYDNLDFGTVKGFSLTYDLRRTRNFTINANYTLQFADGTGSSSGSSRGLTSRGNIRTIFPFSYDERHRVNLVLDYRLPDDFKTKWLRNTGINIQSVGNTGRPYTRTNVPQPFNGEGRSADLNGARRPFNYTINAQINKNIAFKTGGQLRLYVRVSNLLDRRNVIGVYSFTGSPSDPGFLQSEFGQDALDQQTGFRTPESYLASYQWRVLNPNFFSLPRRIFAGAVFTL